MKVEDVRAYTSRHEPGRPIMLDFQVRHQSIAGEKTGIHFDLSAEQARGLRDSISIALAQAGV